MRQRVSSVPSDRVNVNTSAFSTALHATVVRLTDHVCASPSSSGDVLTCTVRSMAAESVSVAGRSSCTRGRRCTALSTHGELTCPAE